MHTLSEVMVHTKSQRGNSSAGAAPPSGERTVLILDDDPIVRRVLCRFLQDSGYQTLEATSIDEAGRLSEAARVVAVILDVRLSGGRPGLGVLAQLRRQAALAATPAIVMTGVTLSDTEQGVITEHQAHLFYKPEGLTSLVGFLGKVTGRDQPR